jgi:hypothetical protein
MSAKELISASIRSQPGAHPCTRAEAPPVRIGTRLKNLTGGQGGSLMPTRTRLTVSLSLSLSISRAASGARCHCGNRGSNQPAPPAAAAAPAAPMSGVRASAKLARRGVAFRHPT